MDWSGSVALITGASRGIGAAVARAAAARGARVGLIARATDDLERVLAASGGRGAVATADVSERAQVEQAIESLERALGPVDILVNNAGVGAHGAVADLHVETFERLVRVNYLGAVYATKKVLPGMIERRRGHIVNVASIAGRIGAPKEAAYSATKFALTGFAEALAAEARRAGVGVSMIHPGPVATEFFDARGVPYQRSFPRPIPAEAVADRVLKAVEHDLLEQYVPRWLRLAVVFRTVVPPAFRWGTARDIGGARR